MLTWKIMASLSTFLGIFVKSTEATSWRLSVYAEARPGDVMAHKLADLRGEAS
jgi:hypothetical protein